MTIQTIKKVFKEKMNQELEHRKGHYQSDQVYVSKKPVDHYGRGWVVSVEIEIDGNVRFELTNYSLFLEEELNELIEKVKQMKALF